MNGAVNKAAGVASTGPAWWRQPSAIALILANLLPLAGVLFAGWQIYPLLLLFWLENLVIGLYTIVRMLMVHGGLFGKLFYCAFFIFHFGVFAVMHSIILRVMFGGEDISVSGSLDLLGPSGPLALAAGAIIDHGLWWALLALIASHGISFYQHYLRPRSYRTADPVKLMNAPYPRVMILHVAILLGGFAAIKLGEPLVALVLLLVLKVAIDLAAHLREHRQAPPLAQRAVKRP